MKAKINFSRFRKLQTKQPRGSYLKFLIDIQPDYYKNQKFQFRKSQIYFLLFNFFILIIYDYYF